MLSKQFTLLVYVSTFCIDVLFGKGKYKSPKFYDLRNELGVINVFYQTIEAKRIKEMRWNIFKV